jgi:four helix bundle protein
MATVGLFLANGCGVISALGLGEMAIQSYRDLLVWQKSMNLAADIERLATKMASQRRYGLASQLRSASTSIPLNIAEGSVRPTRVYLNHLSIALGSEAELYSQLRLVGGSGLAPSAEIETLLDRADEIGRMLRGLMRSLRIHLSTQER